MNSDQFFAWVAATNGTAVYLTTNERAALSALIDNKMADGGSKYGRTPETMVDLGRLQNKLDGDT